MFSINKLAPVLCALQVASCCYQTVVPLWGVRVMFCEYFRRARGGDSKIKSQINFKTPQKPTQTNYFAYSKGNTHLWATVFAFLECQISAQSKFFSRAINLWKLLYNGNADRPLTIVVQMHCSDIHKVVPSC